MWSTNGKHHPLSETAVAMRGQRTRRLAGLLALALVLNACRPPAPPAPAPSGAPPATPAPLARIVGYYAQWATGRGVLPAALRGDRLTHLNYAFANVSPEGECVLGDPAADVERAFTAGESVGGAADSGAAGALRGNFNQLRQLKAKYPHLQVLISIGGWTWSEHFSGAAASDTARQAFARSCIALFLKQYAGVFDGLDIDWEYPGGGGLAPGRPEDKHNFTLLLAELRRQLDAAGAADGRRYLLTIAAPAGPDTFSHYEFGDLVRSLDWINLMAYDLHGTWESKTNFNAPLYRPTGDAVPGLNADAAVSSYLRAGVPANRLVLGVPFYGHGWQGVPQTGNGLFQPAGGAAPGSWGESGAFDYRELKAHYFSTYTRYWDDQSQVPWLYSPADGIFISYDDPQSLEAKADYAVDHGLGGMMIWELSQDDPDGSLLAALYARLDSGMLGTRAPRPTRPATPAAGDTPAAGAPRPFEKELHRVSGIQIDGRLADWTGDPAFVFDKESQIVYRLAPGNWAGPQDFSAAAWAGWDENGLYVACRVLDDRHVQIWPGSKLWQGDYLELQVDTQLEQDYADTTMSDDDYQLGFSPGDFAAVPPEAAVWFGPATADQIAAIRLASVKTADGYVLEAFVPKELLQGMTFAEGASFGLNVNPSDTDDAAQPQKLMMSTSPARQLTDPTTLGKVELVP